MKHQLDSFHQIAEEATGYSVTIPVPCMSSKPDLDLSIGSQCLEELQQKMTILSEQYGAAGVGQAEIEIIQPEKLQIMLDRWQEYSGSNTEAWDLLYHMTNDIRDPLLLTATRQVLMKTKRKRENLSVKEEAIAAFKHHKVRSRTFSYGLDRKSVV